MKNKIILIRLLITFLIVLVILGSFIIYNSWPIWTGQRIILDTQPVDPFDPFRGQYMNIRYEISEIEVSENFEKGDGIFILLKEDENGVWRFGGYSKFKPSRKDFIRGEVERKRGDSVWVLYGIEQFFFEQNAQVPTQNITVEVAVANSGRAKLVQLLQNGKPIKIEYD